MKTPISDTTIESIKKGLIKSSKLEFQDNILKLAMKCCYFTCGQACNFANEFHNNKYKIIAITTIYPNISDKINKQIILNYLGNDIDISLFEKIIFQNYKYKNLNIEYSKELKFEYSDLKTNTNLYINKIKNKINLNKNNIENLSKKLISSKGLYGDPNNFLIDDEVLDEILNNKILNSEKDKRQKINELKDLLENSYICTINSVKIMKKFFFQNDDLKKNYIMTIYPFLYEPQNIEILIFLIDSEEEKDITRKKVIDCENYYFEIPQNYSGNSICCCIIF